MRGASFDGANYEAGGCVSFGVYVSISQLNVLTLHVAMVKQKAEMVHHSML